MYGTPEFITAEVAYRSQRVSREYAAARHQSSLRSWLHLPARPARRTR